MPISAAFSTCVRRAAHHGGERAGGHRARDADLALAADFGAGDRRVLLVEDADRRGRQQERRRCRRRSASGMNFT